MKKFFSNVMATMVGLFLFGLLISILSIVSFAGMAVQGNMTAPIEKKSILRIKLDGTLEERTEENPLAILNSISKTEGNALSLEEALIALDKAAKNEKIMGIYLEGGSLGATPAMAEELRDALLEFKKSGKWIVSYADTYSKMSYYLCSVADQILLNPNGILIWNGLGSNPMFFKDVLEKIGVKMQVFKVGTYKSAVEPFICTEMSPANREQVTSYLNSIWNNMQKDVAESRKTTVENLNQLADSNSPFSEAKEMTQNGLADKLCYIDEVKKILKEKVEIEEDDELKFVTLKDVAQSETLNEKISDEIAVYYAYGDIVDQAGSGIRQGAQIVGKKVIKDLEKLRKDDDVKAVVIRVNSGGGSAYASEQMWHEIELLKAEKPVVVSMGGMAASGGYYISCSANKIFAEPTTLTGSIGIFGLVPDASELLTQKIGLKFDVVKTNALSDLGSLGRPFNETECALIQASVNKGYEQFTGRVATGRKMKIEDVKAIAEGRVWTGEQALEIGLVDQLGDLNDAIAEAGKLAKIEKYSIARYPGAEPWLSKLMNQGRSGYMEQHLRQLVGDTYYDIFNMLHSENLRLSPIQAIIPFNPNIQ